MISHMSLALCGLLIPLVGMVLSGAAQGAEGGAAGRIPVILDTDIGDDIDDTWALAMLLASPRIDLKLIVTSTDDTTDKARLVAKILERLGRTDIPLGIGVNTKGAPGTQPLNQARWLGDYDLAKYPGKILTDGVAAMATCIEASATTVTICAIGPQTNLAALLKRTPQAAHKARVVAMAGSVDIGYGGKQGADPEYNIFRDVPAARAVMAAPWEVVWAPLDSCGMLSLGGERYQRVAASAAPRAKVVMENYELWANRDKCPKDQSSILFDTLAAYLCEDEAFCQMETVNLSLDDKGKAVRDEKGKAVRCAMALKNRDAMEELIIKSLVEK